MVCKEMAPITNLSVVAVTGLVAAMIMESSGHHCLLGTIWSDMTGKPGQVAYDRAVHPFTEAHLPMIVGSKCPATGLHSICSSSGQFYIERAFLITVFLPCFETGPHVIQAGVKISNSWE